MQLHELKRHTKNRKSRLIGRGGKRGTTSGRGTKGQIARAGHKVRPELRDIIKKLPKLRGRGKNSNLSIKAKSATVTLSVLNKNFNNGETVTPLTLLEKKLVRPVNGRLPKVKVLVSGDLTKKLTFKNCSISAPAKVLIEKAGGTIA
jgi:large subunit ribosomal protein L15